MYVTNTVPKEHTNTIFKASIKIYILAISASSYEFDVWLQREGQFFFVFVYSQKLRNYILKNSILRQQKINNVNILRGSFVRMSRSALSIVVDPDTLGIQIHSDPFQFGG